MTSAPKSSAIRVNAVASDEASTLTKGSSSSMPLLMPAAFHAARADRSELRPSRSTQESWSDSRASDVSGQPRDRTVATRMRTSQVRANQAAQFIASVPLRPGRHAIKTRSGLCGMRSS